MTASLPSEQTFTWSVCCCQISQASPRRYDERRSSSSKCLPQPKRQTPCSAPAPVARGPERGPVLWGRFGGILGSVQHSTRLAKYTHHGSEWTSTESLSGGAVSARYPSFSPVQYIQSPPLPKSFRRCLCTVSHRPPGLGTALLIVPKITPERADARPRRGPAVLEDVSLSLVCFCCGPPITALGTRPPNRYKSDGLRKRRKPCPLGLIIRFGVVIRRARMWNVKKAGLCLGSCVTPSTKL